MQPALTRVYQRIEQAGIFCAWSKSFWKIGRPILLLVRGNVLDSRVSGLGKNR
jgi:hypothetical protein